MYDITIMRGNDFGVGRIHRKILFMEKKRAKNQDRILHGQLRVRDQSDRNKGMGPTAFAALDTLNGKFDFTRRRNKIASISSKKNTLGMTTRRKVLLNVKGMDQVKIGRFS